MKIKDLIFETPEMTEEKLLTIIDENLKMVDSSLRRRLKGIHKGSCYVCAYAQDGKMAKIKVKVTE